MVTLPSIEQSNRLFISYAHKDNELFDEAVAIFAKDISNFYAAKTGNSLSVFFDRQSIGWGDNWRAEIDYDLDNAMIFMPIITMQYFNRSACRDELIAFKSSAERLGVKELILPVVIAGAKSITADHDIPEVRIIEALQYRNLESAFLAGPGTPEWRMALSELTDELIEIIAKAEAEQEARRSSGQPALPSDAAVDSEDGDLLQEMSDLTTLSVRVEEEVEEAGHAVGEWVEAISEDMEAFSAQRTPQQMRAISLRMANKAKDPSIRLREAGISLATTTAEADAIIRLMIEQLARVDHPEAREAAKQLAHSMRSDSPELQSLITQMSGVLSMLTVFELMSSPLRKSLKPARIGINKLQDAFRIVDSWNGMPEIG
ncbi:toll/interleukin-1 receptor domain-containing protein [Streptomyces sp. NPDC056165]|uniref:toll/interleukin-1 receptor domain-containing protein n=1 Tax=Streptomyces sp. NPDC056165 TaxID=3345733 RepID=UPI0035DF8C04